MTKAQEVLEKVYLDPHRWRNLWEMSNIGSRHTGLPTLIHLYQGQLKHAPRVKVQIDPGRPNPKNTVSVSIHDSSIVKGPGHLVSKFNNSYHHNLVRRFIQLNKDLLLSHSKMEIDDDELRDKIQKV